MCPVGAAHDTGTDIGEGGAADHPTIFFGYPMTATNAIAATEHSVLATPAGSAKHTLRQVSHWSAAEWWSVVKASLTAWLDDYAPSMGAALSYYTVFSLAPLLVIVISVAGLIFGDDAVRGAVFGQISGLMGAEAAKGIQDLLSSVHKSDTGVLGTILGVAFLLIGATTVFGELQDALDRIWRAPARTKSSGLVTLLRTRVLSFGMILGIAFLLMISLVTGAAIAAFGKWWGGWFAGWELLLQIINAVVGFVMTTAVFALIYKLMPRVKVGWGDVWVGAAVTALLFTVGRLLISVYIGKTGVASGFGAAGSVAVIFVWVYYSSQIFLVGAEFTWVYAQRMGSRRGTAAPTPQAGGPAPAVPVRSADHPAVTNPPTGAAATVAARGADPTPALAAPASMTPTAVQLLWWEWRQSRRLVLIARQRPWRARSFPRRRGSVGGFRTAVAASRR